LADLIPLSSVPKASGSVLGRRKAAQSGNCSAHCRAWPALLSATHSQ